MHRKVYLSVVGVVGAVILITVPIVVTNNNNKTKAERVAVTERIDCYPESEGGVDVVTEPKCRDRGCLYDPEKDEEHPRAPPCYFPRDDYGFRVVDGPLNILHGQRWVLEPINAQGPFGPNLARLHFDVESRSDRVVRIKLDAAGGGRFTPPVPLSLPADGATDPSYVVTVYQAAPFAFRVTRKETGAVLWDTGVGGLVFSDQFLQLATRLPTSNLYGFGEHAHRSFRHDMDFQTWPMWARDQPPESYSVLDGQNYNLYSVQPFYELMEEDGSAHGVFFFNANSMDVTVTPAPMLVYKTIGGVLDFYMFLGPSPEDVADQYTQLVGRPYFPPYWSLGFQLCRYGYRNVSHMQAAMERTVQYGIPVDVQYADIDYMDRQRDFTLDPVNFPDLPQYFDELRSRGMKTIVILDPTLEINDTYAPYLQARDIDGYIQWPSRESMPEGDYEEYNRTDMMGYVWPEWKCVFPDFFLPEVSALWTELTVHLRTDLLPFDGLWLDMNEPANFDTNKDKVWNWPDDRLPYWSLKCAENPWDDPPFRTKASYMNDNVEEELLERLSGKTICMVGTQAAGQYRHYDVHSLYGWKQAEVSIESVRAAVAAAEGVPRRTLLISRSMYAGSGQHAGHWLGDNWSRWEDMRLSVIGMLDFSLFGVPYIGADICGFFDVPSPELCRRWMELGAFYTFSRNHNHEDSPDQDPGVFGAEVADPSREALLARYRLLPYLYTLFHAAHRRGATVIRPLHHEFPHDRATYDIERQFLWGPAFLINPILDPAPFTMTYYLPEGRWYDYYTGGVLSTDGEETMELEVDDDTAIQLAVRGGHILPTQRPANTTYHSRLNPFGLIVALDAVDGSAEGTLFWDDGESIDTFENGDYYMAEFECKESVLTVGVTHMGADPGPSLDNVTVLGVSAAPDRVLIDGQEHAQFSYSPQTQVLEINNATLPMLTGGTIQWIIN